MGNVFKKSVKRRQSRELYYEYQKFIVHLLEAVPNDIEKLNFSDYQEQKEKKLKKYCRKMS